MIRFLIKPPKLSVILPTLNEQENIHDMLCEIENVFNQSQIDGEIIIVDDSTDETRNIVKKEKEKFKNITLIERENKTGVTSAVLEGFENAKSDIFLVMDSDFSHPTSMIPKLFDPINQGDCDFTIGSRYIQGGSTKNWPLSRKIISKVAKFGAKVITDIHDPLSGFFAIRRNVLNNINIKKLGNKICLELIAKGNYQNIKEIPFIFEQRRSGYSKLDTQVMSKYVMQLISILFSKNSVSRMFLFYCVVGAIGTLINVGLLTILVDFLQWDKYISAFISSFVATISNFIFNKIITFKKAKVKSVEWTFSKYLVVSTFTISLNVLLYSVMINIFSLWHVMSMIIAILITMIIGFIVNKIWSFELRMKKIKIETQK